MLIPGRWYALHVRRNAEKAVARYLEEKAYEPFVPTYISVRRWKQRMVRSDRPLFENYVFCRITPRATAPIVTTPGVIRIVGAAGQPIPVDDQEIEALFRIVNSGLRVEPWPYHYVGRRVRVESGPLRGVEGVLCKVVHEDRLVIAITLLRRAVNVELESNTVLPIEPDTQAIREMLNQATDEQIGAEER